jgi:phosphatidylinositol glycan class B
VKALLDPARFLLSAGFLVGLWLRLQLAWTDQGIFWPDEIYQTLEPAHRLVFGYGMVAWEFVQGARSWTLPGFIAFWMGLGKLVGWNQPEQYVRLVKVVFAVLGALTGLSVYALGRSLNVRPWLASVGACAFWLAAPAIYFGFRPMSETLSALFVGLGMAWVLSDSGRRNLVFWGAAFLAFSVFLRLHNAILCVAVLVWLSWRRRWSALEDVGGVFFLGALGFGLLDKLTWGGWFHSAFVYLRFNLIEGRASIWGEAPWTYYPRTFFTSMPALAMASTLGVVLALVLTKDSRVRALFATVVVFVLVHILVPHKEYRFLFAAWPLWFGLLAVGLEAVAERGSKWVALPAGLSVLFLSAASAGKHRELTFGQLGQYEELKPHQSAYDDFGDANRLLMRAGKQEDLCGLKVEAAHLAWVGGFTFLHRDVPLYSHFGPPREAGVFNYVLTRAGTATNEVAREGPFALVKLADKCRVDPTYTNHLP